MTWTSTKLASLPSGSINANPLQAAKTATNFMQFTDGTGLEVGNKTSGSWSGYRTKISASAFEILNRAGTTLAYYGDKLIQLGKNAKMRLLSYVVVSVRFWLKQNPAMRLCQSRANM